MSNNDFAIKYLKAIERQHENYFENSKLNIMDCVEIKGNNVISVHVTQPGLPFEIRHNIEMMFWVE